MSNFRFIQSIASLDAYGSKIDLQFKSRKKHPTIFGGLITILNVAVLIYVSISYSSKLIDKSKPVIIFSEENVKLPEFYNLTESSFSISFGLENQIYQHYIDETVYSIQVSQFSSKNIYNQEKQQYEQQIIVQNLEVYPGKTDNFKVEGTQDYFKQLIDIGELYCLNQTNNKAWIGGDFTADYFGMVELKIFQCVNKTDEEKKVLISMGQKVIECQSQEQIDNLLSKSIFSLYHTDKIFNPKDFSNPFTTITRDLFWPVSNQLVKQLSMYFRNVYVESETGIIQREIQKQRDVIFSYQTEQVIYGQNNQFISLIMRFEKNKESKYFRSYGQIENIIAQISGVMNFVVLVSSFICLRMSSLDLSKNLVNEVFTFYEEEQEEQKQKNDKALIKNIEKVTNTLNNSQKLQQMNKTNAPLEDSILQIDEKNASSSNKQSQQTKYNQNEILSKYIKTYKQSSPSQTSQTNKEQKKFKDLISKLFQVTKSALKLKAYEYVLYYIFPCWKSVSKKKRKIDYSQQLLDKHLDAMYIVNKLQEIDKLKMLLLTEDQIKLFNYLPKPTIKIDDLLDNKNQSSKLINTDNQKLNSSLDTQSHKQEPSSIRILLKNKYSYIEQFNILYMDERSDIEKASDAYSAFKKLRNLQSRTSIDTKLLLMLDRKILDFFLDEGEMNIYHDIIKLEEEQSPLQVKPDEWKSKQSIFLKEKNQLLNQQELDLSTSPIQKDVLLDNSIFNNKNSQRKFNTSFEGTETIHPIKNKQQSEELSFCLEQSNLKQQNEVQFEYQTQNPVSDFNIPPENNPNYQDNFKIKQTEYKKFPSYPQNNNNNN